LASPMPNSFSPASLMNDMSPMGLLLVVRIGVVAW
jgi:hypothetical protein